MGMLGGPWGIALTGATLAVTGWMQAQENARQAAAELTQTLDEQTGAFTDSSRQFIMDAFAFDVSAEDLSALREYGVNLQEAVDVALQGGPAMEEYQKKLRELGVAHPEVAKAARGLSSSIENQNEVVQQSRLQWENQRAMLGEVGVEFGDLRGKASQAADALFEAARGAESTEEPLQTLEEAAKEAAEQQERLTDALVGMVDAAFGAQDAAINYEASLDALTEAIKENGETHDITTEKGRNNQKALLDVAKAAREQAKANLENGDSLFQVQKDMERAREAFIKGAEAMGYDTTEAAKLADQLGLTDEGVRDLSASIDDVPSKTVNVTVNGVDSATSKVQILQGNINKLTGKTVNVYVVTNYSERGRRPVYTGGNNYAVEDGGIITPYADGGVDMLGRYVPRTPQIGGPKHGKRYILWGEDATTEEAYISRKPGMEARNKAILETAAKWFGGRVSWYANGGFSPAAAPQVSVDYSALAAALAALPDRIEVPVTVDSREIARAAARGNAQLSGRLVR